MPILLHLIVTAVLTAMYALTAQGGICWLTHSARGRCQHLDQLEMTRNECCRANNVNGAWSEHNESDLRPGQFFYWETLEGGADKCQPCHTTCENVDCGTNKKCVMRGGRPKCVCAPDCEEANRRHKGAVCGLDGRSYRSNCSLVRHNCRWDRDVRVDYIGRCQKSCDKVVCAKGKNCVVDQYSLPHCVTCIPLVVCQRMRTPQDKVCGADGVTYPNVCYYRRASCLSGQAIGIAYHGECREDATCADVTCGRSQQCLVHSVTKKPKCVTCTPCSPMETDELLCGTDNRNYYSWCEMQEEACRSGVVIEIKHKGLCSAHERLSNEYYDEMEGYEYGSYQEDAHQRSANSRVEARHR